MVGYAVKAVPWSGVTVAAGLVVALMELVARWPWTVWPLQGAAVGVLAGASAWCFDEPAAAVVDPAPRSLRWRTTARASGVVLLVGVWAVEVGRSRENLFDHPWTVLLQGVGAVLAGAAWATWRRSGGEPTPGLLSAAAVVPFATTWALVRPLDEQLPVFPYGFDGGGDWALSRAGWIAAAVCAALLLVGSAADARWTWRRRPGPPAHPESGSARATTTPRGVS